MWLYVRKHPSENLSYRQLFRERKPENTENIISQLNGVKSYHHRINVYTISLA